MSDKLISLESVLKEIRRFKGYIDDDMIERFSIAFKRLPAVPHEMSARELFNAYQRICEEYSHKGIPIRCDECPLYSICPEIGRAIRVMVIWSTIIERWAREHPETDMMTANYALPRIDFKGRSEE